MPALTFFFAFVAVLALIGAAAWLVRRFAGNRLGANANRGRMPRLAVIDAAAVDGRRRLVLVRRDNVEHLLMIGGPSDIVVESNIVRATSRDQIQQRQAAGTELPRISPLADAGNWAENEAGTDHPEPQQPEPLPPRPVRPAFAEEARRAMPDRRAELMGREQLGRADAVGRADARAEALGRAEPIAGFAPEPPPRAEPRLDGPPPRIPRGEPPLMQRAPLRPVETSRPGPLRVQERAAAPPPPPPAPAAAPSQPSADQNLADMAQRLEAALRRPAGEPRPDAPAEPRAGVLPVAPEPPPSRPVPRPPGEASNGTARSEPPAPKPAPAPAPKTGFENLEDEMASLLGRPKTPS